MRPTATFVEHALQQPTWFQQRPGAAKAVGLVLPELTGKLNGLSVRVPTPNVSMVDLVFQSTKPMTAEAINTALRDAASGGLSGVLGYTELPLVSSDFVSDPHSAIIDGASTQVMGDHLAKVLAWYDNEWILQPHERSRQEDWTTRINRDCNHPRPRSQERRGPPSRRLQRPPQGR